MSTHTTSPTTCVYDSRCSDRRSTSRENQKPDRSDHASRTMLKSTQNKWEDKLKPSLSQRACCSLVRDLDVLFSMPQLLENETAKRVTILFGGKMSYAISGRGCHRRDSYPVRRVQAVSRRESRRNDRGLSAHGASPDGMGGQAAWQCRTVSAAAVDAVGCRRVPGSLRAGRLESPPPEAREIHHQQFCQFSD